MLQLITIIIKVICYFIVFIIAILVLIIQLLMWHDFQLDIGNTIFNAVHDYKNED